MSRSRHSSKCGRSCWVCNCDKLKGHGGDWMKASDRRRVAFPDDEFDYEEGLRRYDDWAASEADARLGSIEGRVNMLALEIWDRRTAPSETVAAGW